MRKVVLMSFLSMVLVASGQTVHRVNEIKSVAYGALRLIEDAVFSESKVYEVDSTKPKENATGN